MVGKGGRNVRFVGWFGGTLAGILYTIIHTKKQNMRSFWTYAS